jgi:hypothetical protein
MKSIFLKSLRILKLLSLATVATCFSVCAAEVETPWNQICRMAGGRQLTITTVNGGIVEGYCVSINVNDIQIRTENQQLVKVARASLARLRMQASKGHQLSSLGKGIGKSFRTGTQLLLTPFAPAGLVLMPAAAAWGAVAAPFCLLGDLVGKMEGEKDIKVI